MQTEVMSLTISAFLAAAASAQTYVTESTERVVHLANAPTSKGFQEMATALRVVAQISKVTIDSEHNSFNLRGNRSDLAMADWMIHMMDKPAGWQPSNQEVWNPATREYRVAADRNPVARVYYLANTTSARDLQEIITVLRSVANIQKIFSYTPATVVVYRGSVEEVELGEWLIRKLDLPVTAHASAQGVEALQQESPVDVFRLSAPQRDGSEDLVRVFYLNPTVSAQVINEMTSAMHKRGGIMRVFSHTAPPAIAVRGNPTELARAKRIIEEMETAAAR